MTKVLRRKLVIEIVYENKHDAVDLIRQIHANNIHDSFGLKLFKNTAYMQT